MTVRKTVASLLAVGTILTSTAGTAQEKNLKETTTNKTEQVSESKKVSMPSWIPTTKDGQFDEKGAAQQFETIWNKNGKDLQEYVAKVKEGVPEEIAYTQLASKLANGDKKQEEEFLALHDAIKPLQRKKNEMLSDQQHRGSLASMMLLVASFTLLALSAGGKQPDELKRNCGLCVALATVLCGTGAGIGACVKICQSDQKQFKNAFVKLQKAAYKECEQQAKNPEYKAVEVRQAQQKIQAAQQKESSR